MKLPMLLVLACAGFGQAADPVFVVTNKMPVQPKATPAIRSPVGHTHTCAACAAKGIVSTWDHATVSGHSCPTCGREQLEQDPVPRPVTVGKVTQPIQQYQLPQFGTSGCPGGVCNVPQQQTRPFLFPRLRGQ